ncbi:glycosyltransferase family 2 protein [Pontibaca salina]|uniref:Glycosyltransferase family 2 protein n=1 Tax=Pontibaca salina TaxID=2795731 RepID=A0A934HRP2_9RHOB|nr:glycosyltransferase family 2 protein [Pontibaca salina]MBI6628973.1 glycosyltransferase family 2 protein [Pontibaca salina]
MKFLAVLTLRNEGAFLLEWLAHHRAVGFTDFLVFSNNCQDGTDTMLDRLAELGWLTHVRNDGPYDKAGIQFTALKHADRMDMVHNADWLLSFDIDEFVNIHTGNGTLPALLAVLPDATAITLTWRLFGNDNMVRYEDRPVLETFTGCAPAVIHWPWRATMFKTLYRNDGTYGKLGVHRPRSPDKTRLDGARWYDGEGRALDDRFKTRRLFSDYGCSNHALVQLNHYPLGAMESYLLKVDRGRVNRTEALGVDYWVERNFSTDRDTSIQRIDPLSAPLRAELHNDPILGDLHHKAVSWRKQRFATLMTQEPFYDLFTRLLMTPPSRAIDQSTARMLIRFVLSDAG